MTTTSTLESTLIRVVAVARTVGVAWMVALGVVALVRGYSPTILTVIGLAVIWAVTSLTLYRTNPPLVKAFPCIGVDVALAAAAIVVSNAGQPEQRFSGGMPLVAVAIAAIRGRKAAWAVAGVLLAVVLASLSATDSLIEIVDNVGQIIFYVAGAFIFGWTVAILRQSERTREAAETALAEAETSRVRAEERAEFSRRIHDSVLQALALIQRSAGDPEAVVTLARGQERDLRQWLFGAPSSPEGSLVESVESVAKEVEERYKVVVEVVAVGDRPLTPIFSELVAAAREAMVNGAVHGGGAVDVYVEANATGCVVFVRDRGPGFALDDIPADRGGVRNSIIGRMERIGGRARLRSDPRRGAEWELEVSSPPGTS